jgi:hypothetical protein
LNRKLHSMKQKLKTMENLASVPIYTDKQTGNYTNTLTFKVGIIPQQIKGLKRILNKAKSIFMK